MLSPNQEMALMADRKRELLQKARLHQLYQQAEQDRAQLGDRLMTLIGDLMISGGTKLKEHSSVHYAAEAVEAQNV